MHVGGVVLEDLLGSTVVNVKKGNGVDDLLELEIATPTCHLIMEATLTIWIRRVHVNKKVPKGHKSIRLRKD